METYSFHRYASARLEKLTAEGKITRKSRLAKWASVSEAELEGFFAIVINIGGDHCSGGRRLLENIMDITDPFLFQGDVQGSV